MVTVKENSCVVLGFLPEAVLIFRGSRRLSSYAFTALL
jgi:hypothetical protein